MSTKKATTRKSVRKSAKKAATKVANGAKSGAKKASQSTRQFIDASLKIIKKVSDNPRREGTFGYKSFQLIKSGMTVEQFVKKGGRLRDLHWDVDHEYVELKKA